MNLFDYRTNKQKEEFVVAKNELEIQKKEKQTNRVTYYLDLCADYQEAAQDCWLHCGSIETKNRILTKSMQMSWESLSNGRLHAQTLIIQLMALGVCWHLVLSRW